MLLAAILLLAQTAPADRAAACKATDASLPPALSGWSTPGDELVPGKAVKLDTVDAATLKGLPTGARPGRAVAIAFTVAAAGTYGIALDQGGWIDVVAAGGNGAAIPSSAHGHGPDCSSIRKIVRFDLRPGGYRLYLSGLAGPSAKVMLVAP